MMPCGKKLLDALFQEYLRGTPSVMAVDFLLRSGARAVLLFRASVSVELRSRCFSILMPRRLFAHMLAMQLYSSRIMN